ncbi:hypothetical protein POTOM_005854 [Populus tomentosa]|uniref:Uncharacterized protein n=1 Tax=Populus tomentosa TaxID=118781 RepID=A0A8X8AX59_POPTO|nr:hypothetical protein POTOM_005854 [Populus tomentosa]
MLNWTGLMDDQEGSWPGSVTSIAFRMGAGLRDKTIRHPTSEKNEITCEQVPINIEHTSRLEHAAARLLFFFSPFVPSQIIINCRKIGDDALIKLNKANEAKRMIFTAENDAARLFLGNDDLISKWQHVQLQCHRGLRLPANVQQDKDVSHLFSNIKKDSRSWSRIAREREEGLCESKKNPFEMPQENMMPSLSIKDVVGALEMEDPVSKSVSTYRLNEKMYDAADAQGNEEDANLSKKRERNSDLVNC